ncbi:hypothetical protein SY27_08455 [Flavobacterium sp. 316]|uniref:hypothetical protein n=1 Tax=Flavobacterium sp. 316 TaxID=1603293 RepID=UPI0005E37021|nr:hypothetical protein [Flavobacterium sp. 316]KIX21795.1 hypothetical protein SY27_08455 [Flavobacterium sp. 316]
MMPKNTAYVLLRITMGINIFCHGFVRIPKLTSFRDWMVNTFVDSMLPSWTVYSWGTILPFIEFIIGLFLIIGFRTYETTIAGASMIAILIFGSCLTENWEWAGIQMIYALFFYFLISNIENNKFVIDTKNKLL